MRFNTLQIAVATLLVSGVAIAGQGAGEKSKLGGGGGPSSSAPTSSGLVGGGGAGLNEGAASGSDLRWGGLMDIRKAGKDAPKPWEVGVGFESHTMLIRNDLEGNAANKDLIYGYLYGHADITSNNRVSLHAGFYRRFLADESESGFRADDIYLTYTRRVLLPMKVEMRASGTLSLPISFSSRLAGTITAPRVGVAFRRQFDFGLSVDARVFATYYIQRYTTSGTGSGSCMDLSGPVYVQNCTTPDAGGTPNTRAGVGGLVEAEYEFWFHKRLTIGADLFSEHVWYYFDPSSGDTSGVSPDGVVHLGQPAQQIYGGEIFLRYSFRPIYGIRSDLTASFAQGDPAMGYGSVLHDGIQHVLGFWRLTSEFYAAVSVRY